MSKKDYILLGKKSFKNIKGVRGKERRERKKDRRKGSTRLNQDSS